MWNDRYLHIDSNHGDYSLYSKKTFVVSLLSDEHVSDFIMFKSLFSVMNRRESNRAPYSMDVRMYYARCYVIANAEKHQDNLHIHAYTYRRRHHCIRFIIGFCPVTVFVMTILAFTLLCYPSYAFLFLLTARVFLQEAVFYGSSIIIFIASLASIITYVDMKSLFVSFPCFIHSHLPGACEIKNTILATLPVIGFYTFFFVHICSFILRILLNWYHFSINELGRVPHIISFFGPLICQYQYW